MPFSSGQVGINHLFAASLFNISNGNKLNLNNDFKLVNNNDAYLVPVRVQGKKLKVFTSAAGLWAILQYLAPTV